MPRLPMSRATSQCVKAWPRGFTILTAARSGETRGMTWAEVDLENASGRSPPIACSKEHRVPHEKAALAFLGHRRDDKPLVFESEIKSGKAISEIEHEWRWRTASKTRLKLLMHDQTRTKSGGKSWRHGQRLQTHGKLLRMSSVGHENSGPGDGLRPVRGNHSHSDRASPSPLQTASSNFVATVLPPYTAAVRDRM